MSERKAYDTTEAEQRVLNDGRMIRGEADILLPLLRQQKDAAVSRIIYEFKGGKLDALPAAAASLAAIEDMITTITNRIKKAEIIERKIHG